MKVHIAFIVLVALAYQVIAGSCPSFTASFLLQTSSRGASAGTMYMDWTNGRMSLEFPSANYRELYIFNGNKGYPVPPTGYLTQFQNQYIYKTATGCDCETRVLNSAVPPFFADLSLYTFGTTNYNPFLSVTTPKTTPLGQCTSYIANPQQAFLSNLNAGTASYTPYYLFNSISFLNDGSGTPCSWVMNDDQNREFIFTKVTCGVPAASHFTPPTTCKCGKPIDVVFSIDRTGSITQREWAQEHLFVQNVVNQFTYGPQACNMGICDWNKNFWVTIDILAGTTFDAVNTAVQNMGCCPGYDPTNLDTWCCCCNTPIGGGLYQGAQLLLESKRTTATKLLILLTDGCQNHIFNATDNSVTPCPGCSSEAQCATSLPCIQDITKNFNLINQQIPGLKVVVVGVGTNQTICTNQLQMAAGGILSNVFNPTSWDLLSTFVQSIVATACTVTDVPCADCCGICVCGNCIAPTNCTLTDADLANKCIKLADRTSSNQCCATEQVICPPKPCQDSRCDPTQGCIYLDLVPPPADANNCTYYICNTTTNSVQSVQSKSQLCITNPPPPQCTTADDSKCVQINGPNKCVIPSCDNKTNTCQFTSFKCPPDNKCYKFSCSYSTGCDIPEVTVCNDLNPCTDDSCDNVTGCVYTPRTCAAPHDLCFNASCNPSTGNCDQYRTNAPCYNFTASNCSVPVCTNSVCNGSNICIVPPVSTGSEEVQTVAVIAGAVTGGAIIGIVVGIVAAAAAVGGGAAYAFTTGDAPAGASNVANNPLFVAPGNEGGNPLYNPAS